MAGKPEKVPKNALTKLIYDFGLSKNELVKNGYFKTPSSLYGAANRDVRKMKIQTVISISEALNITPGAVVNKLLELQKEFPPKYTLKVNSKV